MNRAIGLIIVVMLSLYAAIAWGQDQSAALFNEKYKLIQGHQKNLDESYQNKIKDLDAKFANKAKALDDQFKNKAKMLDSLLYEVETRLGRNESKFNRIELFFELTSITGIIALIAGLYALYNKLIKSAYTKISETFNQHFDKELEKRFQAKEADIKKLIHFHNEELQIKKTKKIMVLSPKEADHQFVEKYFETMEFENVRFEVFDPQKHYVDQDLILFNDLDKKFAFEEEEIINYSKSQPEDIICFYFGDKWIEPKKIGDNFTFAKVKTQLYGNLMSALRFQEVIKRQA